MFQYYRFNAYRGKKLVLSICLCSLDAMVRCVLEFQQFYDKLSITCIMSGKEEENE